MVSPNPNQRKRVLTLIRELQKHTTENGCTEAEALQAAQKISELLEVYQLELSDLTEIHEDHYAAFARTYGGGSARRRAWHETFQTWPAVAHFTDTQYWCRADQLLFFGSVTDCEIAFFLCDLFKNTAELEWQTFRRLKRGRTDRRGRASFMAGFSQRITERLKDLKETRSQKVSKSPTSQALVVLKDQLLRAKFQDYQRTTGLRLRTTARGAGTPYDAPTYGAGAAAGSRIPITVGIGKDHRKSL